MIESAENNNILNPVKYIDEPERGASQVTVGNSSGSVAFALKAIGIITPFLFFGGVTAEGCYTYEFKKCVVQVQTDDSDNFYFNLEGCEMKCHDLGDCFSPNMTVNVKDQGPTSMKDLRPGMIVKLSNGNEFTITDLPHRDPSKVITYLNFAFDGGSLEISPKHHMIVKDKETGKELTLFATKVADSKEKYQIQYQGNWIDISKVSSEEQEGVYTVEGLNVSELEVNGVRVGAYSKTNSPALAQAAMLPRQVWHSLFQPVVEAETKRGETSFEKGIVNSFSNLLPGLFA
ncbi:MAG: hypothetical protein AAGG81_06290 [Chlamydiota bacterium]